MVPRLRDRVNDNVKWRSVDDSLVPFHTKEVMKVLSPKMEKERNQRIFRNKKRTVEKLHTAICEVVKLKLMNVNVKVRCVPWLVMPSLLCPSCSASEAVAASGS
ncbi:hypothetical protein Tco_1237952 [Tanacetum coccineum]